MSDYVNKIKKGEVEYDIQDARVDTLQTEVAGKQAQLTAGDNIKIENNVISASGGGSSSIEVDLTSIENPTLQDLLDALGKQLENFVVDDLTIRHRRWGQVRTFKSSLSVLNYTGQNYSFSFVQKTATANIVFDKDIGSTNPQEVSLFDCIYQATATYNLLPNSFDYDSEKTYILKLVNGSWTLVEEI